jgi:hypothetical protein
LSVEVSLTVSGNKERADGAVGVVSPEVPVGPVEARNHSARLYCLKDGPTDGRIPQGLRKPKVFGLANAAEFAAVFLEVLVKLPLRPESRSRGKQQ